MQDVEGLIMTRQGGAATITLNGPERLNAILSRLSKALNFDVACKGLDEPFSSAELDGVASIQGMRDHVLRVSGKANPAPRDFMQITGRGRLSYPWVGSPRELADMLEEWFHGTACDGFVIGPTHLPGAFADFVHLVVPELPRRGLFRKDCTGFTLRDHLGLPRPDLAAWRKTYGSAG